MKIILGIDTGGTYTDAVACDAETYEIYAEAKSLTTRHDLSIGIYKALEQFPEKYLKNADMVSLSTTLTTNACVENKGCRALLILFGVDEASAKRLGADLGGFDSEDVWYIETETQLNGTIGKMPDWDHFAQTLKQNCSGYEAFAIVEIYANQTGACLERKAKKVIQEIFDCPIVCGHELFTELNVLKRGANALLNAKLIPLITRFLEAINKALDELGIDAQVMIVRSDGTLMSREFAVKCPIETLLCGPVASAMGAQKLTSCQNAIIVDMGGTTSDIALMKRKLPVRVEDFVHIGGWTTFMKGMFIDTFGLGGDTGIRYKDRKMVLDEQRLIPSCVLAEQYPEIIPELKKKAAGKTYTRWIHEYLVLQRPLENTENYTDTEIRLCQLLEKRPYSMGDTARMLGVSIYQMDTERLERNGIILRSGLTPTDIMHLKGDFQTYNKEASYYTAAFVAKNLGISVEELGKQVYRQSKYRLFRNLARILMERENPALQHMDTKILDYLLEKQWQEYETEKDSMKNPAKDDSKGFSFTIHSDIDLIGLGGPAKIFVPDVAEALGVNAWIPEHAQVANALGAALGQIAFTIKVTIDCVYGDRKEGNHLRVTSSGERICYTLEETEQAISYAGDRVEYLALKEARERGMSAQPVINTEIIRKNYPGTDMVNQIVVQAIVQEKARE